MLCPLHMYQRRWCNDACAAERRELARIGADLRQYWHDRRRGVGVMRPAEYRSRGYTRRASDLPLWQAWGRVA
jgi:hypothetical protein